MGISTSTPSYAYDQLYLPADCFRLCHPSSCFCGGARSSGCGHHSRSKYVYVERNCPSGRESYRDPMELVERGMLLPGWGMGNVSAWRQRDWEVMRGLLAQWVAEKRGLAEGSLGGMGGGQQGYAGMGAYPVHHHHHQQQHQPPPPWSQWQGPWQGEWQRGPDGGVGKGGMVVDEETRDRARVLHDIVFGSDAEKQEKQVQEQLLKRLTPMIPELAKLLAMQQAGLNGAGSNGAGGMMSGPLPAGGMPPGPMGMGGMNPYGPAGGMPGMNPMMYSPATMGGIHPMMGGGDSGMMTGSGGDMRGGFGRRRNRGRRAMRDFEYDEDDDDDFGGFGGRGRGGMKRRRRGRYNFDDDDLFGDRGGEASGFRGPPRGGPPRPRPNNGGGGGGGGSTSGGGGAVFDTFNNDARFRTAPAGEPQPAQWTSPRNTAPAPTPMATAPPPGRVLTPVEEPINASPPPMPVNQPGPPPGAIPISPERAAPPYRFFETTHPPTYSGIPVDGFSPARPIPIRHAHFRPEAGLARPRQDEENRGEPQAGGPASPHDITPL